jgi:Arc/MetJ-type ribon-helix-helix transcriptional regulator
LEYDWSALGDWAPDEGAPPGAVVFPLFLRSTLHPFPDVRESKVTVKIPRPLYRKIQAVVEESGFSSPTDFIVYVLRDLMGEAPASAASQSPASGGESFQPAEIEEIRRKLKNLGYL